MKILFLDDHELMHLSFARTLLHIDSSFEMIGVSTLEGALQLLNSGQFDFAFADLRIGVAARAGFELISACTTRGIRSAFYSGDCDANLIAEAAKRGAVGYFPKSYGVEVLAAVLGLVLKFDVSYAPLVADPADKKRGVERMSKECHKIMTLICEGRSNKEIAHRLAMGVDSVKKHLKTCNALLGVTNRREARRAYLTLFEDAKARE